MGELTYIANNHIILLLFGVQIYLKNHFLPPQEAPIRSREGPKSEQFEIYTFYDACFGRFVYLYAYIAYIHYRHWVFSPDMPPKYPLKHPFSCKLLFWLIIVGLFEALLSPPDVITRCFRCSMLNIHYIGK